MTIDAYLTRNALILLGLSTLAATLVIARARLYGKRVYRPMLLNVGLAWTPMIVVLAFHAIFINGAGTDLPEAIVVVLALLTLGLFALFFPNASYLITELNHLRDDPGGVPLWYDVITLLSIVTSGVLLALVSLAYVQALLVAITGAVIAVWIAIVVYLAIANFGVYIGRALRFNSWDAVLRPHRLLADLARHLAGGGARRAAGFTALFTAFLLPVYLYTYLPLDAQLGAGPPAEADINAER